MGLDLDKLCSMAIDSFGCFEVVYAVLIWRDPNNLPCKRSVFRVIPSFQPSPLLTIVFVQLQAGVVELASEVLLEQPESSEPGRSRAGNVFERVGENVVN